MTDLTQLVLLGLGSGALYALAALGLVLVYRSSGVVNFAHTAIGMVGTFVFFELSRKHGWATVPAGIAGVLASALLGYVTYLLVMCLPKTEANLTRVIASLAVLLILQAAAGLRYQSEARVVQDFLPHEPLDLGGGISVSEDRIILLAIAVVLALALGTVYRRTRFGLATSAVSESPRNLAALGWRVGIIRGANWALGGALAGLAGVLLSPIIGVSSDAGVLLIVPVLAAALIGGLSSFSLTLVGGLLIGALQAVLSQHDLGVRGASDAVPFLMIVGVLLLRGKSLPLRSFVGERLPSVGSGRIPVIPLAVGYVLAATWLLGASEDTANAAITTILFGIIVLSLVIVLGYAGQLSLAQVTLAGVGALIAAKLVDGGVPMIPAFVLAVAATIPVGVVLGLPSLRTRGVSLAIATLGLAVAVNALLFGNPDISGGSLGISLAEGGELNLMGWSIDPLLHPGRFALVGLSVFCLLAIATANLRRGRAGRRLIAVRSNERAAAALGISVVGAKLFAFAIASGIAATGGVLIAYRYPTVLFDQFGVFNNIGAVAFSVVGGVGSAPGALAGGNLQQSGLGSTLLSDLSGGWEKYIGLIGGVLLLATVITVPDGLAIAWANAWARLHRLLPARVAAVGKRCTVGRVDRASMLLHAGGDHIGTSVPPRTLEVSNVSVQFGGVLAVRDVSFSVSPGEVVSLIGPNGAGKTTTIDALTGFVSSTGTVRLGDRELTRAAVHQRARAGLARSFQSLELFDDLSVFDNLRAAGDPSDAASYLIDLLRPRRGGLTPATVAAIHTFGLEETLLRRPSEISFGQRRLVAMARSVASEPSVILLDEPCAGLGAHERDEVAALIRTLADERGMGVLLVEHDVNLVRRVSDRIVVLDFGQVIASGPAAEVLEDPVVVSAYLGTRQPDDPELAGVTSTPHDPMQGAH
ncbi:MAG: transporter related protein [Solirubrobacterales bacterium]|nr:transporter related protein [Solirubrobacterales bacterium]